jgi:hypothetical protein
MTRHLNKYDLAAVARISPELRAPAERQLYPDIHLPYVAEDYGKREGDHMEHWPLCQTLSHRLDLAQRVSSMDIIAQDVQHDIEVLSMQLLPVQVYFPATFHIEIPQGTVTGMLLQRLPNLKHLDLTLPLLYDPRRKYKNEDMEVYLPGYEDDLLPQAMRTLFPSFDPQTAHLADPPLLPNLEILHYIGDEMHWALLKSARLQRVYFGRVCNILSDAAPDDVSKSAKMLTMPFRSRILNPGAY